MDEHTLMKRITADPRIFSGKSIIRRRRVAVEHVLGMLAAGDSRETLLEGYSWLELEIFTPEQITLGQLATHWFEANVPL
jgi:uncharacterized protein (DUF433 family)